MEALPRAQPVCRTYVADREVGEVWIAARAGRRPARVRVGFGGREAVFELEAGGRGQARLDGSAEAFSSGGGRRYYPMRVDAGGAHAGVELAADAATAGRMLFRAGERAEALPLLERGARETGDPAAAAAAVVAADMLGVPVTDPRLRELARSAGAVLAGASLLEVYGIGQAYLDALPYAVFGPSSVGARGFAGGTGAGGCEDELLPVARSGRDREEPAQIWTPDMLLDPGHFVAHLALRALDPSVPDAVLLQLADLGGAVLAEERVPVPAADPRLRFDLDFRFSVPASSSGVRVLARWPGEPGVAVRGMRIRPDTAANARELARALLAAGAGPSGPPPGERVVP